MDRLTYNNSNAQLMNSPLRRLQCPMQPRFLAECFYFQSLCCFRPCRSFLLQTIRQLTSEVFASKTNNWIWCCLHTVHIIYTLLILNACNTTSIFEFSALFNNCILLNSDYFGISLVWPVRCYQILSCVFVSCGYFHIPLQLLIINISVVFFLMTMKILSNPLFGRKQVHLIFQA